MKSFECAWNFRELLQEAPPIDNPSSQLAGLQDRGNAEGSNPYRERNERIKNDRKSRMDLSKPYQRKASSIQNPYPALESPQFCIYALRIASSKIVDQDVMAAYRMSAWINCPDILPNINRIAFAILFGRHGRNDWDSSRINLMLLGIPPLNWSVPYFTDIRNILENESLSWNIPQAKIQLLQEESPIHEIIEKLKIQ